MSEPKTVHLLDVSTITVREDASRRPVVVDFVKTLAASIKDNGQLQPIAVDADNVLIYGRHRLEAQRLLGQPVEAYILTMDGLAAGLAEIDENVVRQELTASERALAFANRKDIYEALHPETKLGVAGGKASGRKRGNKSPEESGSVTPSFVEDTAAKTGLAPSTISADVRIADKVLSEPSVVELLQEAGLEDNRAVLRDLATGDKTPAQMKKAIKQHVASTKAPKKGNKPATNVVDVLDPHEPAAVDVIPPHSYVASIIEQIMSLPEDMDVTLASMREYGLAAHPNYAHLVEAANKFTVLAEYITALGGVQ